MKWSRCDSLQVFICRGVFGQCVEDCACAAVPVCVQFLYLISHDPRQKVSPSDAAQWHIEVPVRLLSAAAGVTASSKHF